MGSWSRKTPSVAGAIRSAVLLCFLFGTTGAEAASAFVDPPVLPEAAGGETPRPDISAPFVPPERFVPSARQGEMTQRLIGPQLQGPAGRDGRRTFDLHVQMIRSQIDNPAEGHPDQVDLRGYTGGGVDPKAPFVAPQIEVAPGQRVTVTLHNDLDPDPSCMAHGDMDRPHCFNGTNLHSHGLWVSPAGNGDNVLLSINPKTSFTYYYDLPDDHPSGTFWYHSHRHGSTALQVSSGMAGALIVRGERLPTPRVVGDIDTLLKSADGGRIPEHTLVFQQIQYVCYDDKGKPKTKGGVWYCDPTDVGRIDNIDEFGPGIWAASGRYTTINGLVHPHFTAQSGTVERWRMIHGGVRDTITVAFRPLRPGAPTADNLTAVQTERYVDENCSGAPISYHLIAADGLTMAAAQQVKSATFQPGYRWDALVTFPQAGEYCVTNEAEPKAGSVSQQDKGVSLLATVTVASGTPVPDPGAALTATLVAAAKRTMPIDVRQSVVDDLQNGLKFTRFVPHRTISAEEVSGTQEMTFLIDVTDPNKTKFEVASQSIVTGQWPDRQVNLAGFKPEPYDPAIINRVMPLNGVDEWTLQSGFVGHPFHIHVNPFQIVEILDPSGKDVSAIGSTDGDDPQYAGLKGVWKDTLWVKNTGTGYPDKNNLLKSVYTLRVRTRYERFIGEYVLHCHILDHEDQGMMQNICIDLPGSVGVCGGQSRPAAELHTHH